MVSLNFDRTQTLLGRLGAADRCHLLSISLDVEHDTPEVLAAYAKACRADERGWTFATGREDDVRRLGRTVGLEFKRVDGKIDHNLRPSWPTPTATFGIFFAAGSGVRRNSPRNYVARPLLPDK